LSILPKKPTDLGFDAILPPSAIAKFTTTRNPHDIFKSTKIAKLMKNSAISI